MSPLDFSFCIRYPKTPTSQSDHCISTPVGGAVGQRRTLLRRLQEVDRHPDEAGARRDCVHTPTSRAAERERFAHRLRGTTAGTAPLRAAPAAPEPPAPQRLSPARNAQRQRQVAPAARRRQRGEHTARSGRRGEAARRNRDAAGRRRRGDDGAAVGLGPESLRL
jgi:type IV secretory pathway VirB10-like protein